MRNALLSNLPLPSQFYNIGNNEAHMPYLDAFMQMETKGNVHGDAFCLESNIFNNDNQLRDGAFTIPYQSNFNSNLQDYQCGSFYNGNYFQQSMSLGSCKLEIPQFQSDNQKLQNGRRKRSIVEVQNQQAPLNETTAALNDDPWEKNKRKKYLSTFFERQQYHYSADHQITESAVTEIKDFKFLHLPVRRSQKLSDKITALQKLVSPYGKTDTASVLQEASLYIKLLQEQIQNFFQMLSSSYNSLRATHSQEIGKKHQDLRSRGLCLVPTSFTQE